MKVKQLIVALELGNPDADVFIQKSYADGYFALNTVEATQPEGHIGASGFVIHIVPLDDANEKASS